MPHRFLFITALLCLPWFAISPVAKAQDSLPTLNEFGNEEDLNLPVQQQGQSFSSGNLYLEDVLRLQYQISLLERMVERQGGVARLEKSYADLGVPFNQPDPPYGICAELPANIPCFRAYPDLYDVILPEIAELDVITDDPLNIDMVTLEDDKPEEPEKAQEASVVSTYYWSEILCGGGVCTAVLVKPNDHSYRRTVQQGDMLDDDRIEVVMISSSGVEIRADGEIVELAPALAPAQGGPSSPLLKTTSSSGSYPLDPRTEMVQEILEQNEDLASEEQLPQVAAPTIENMPAESIEDYGAPLGPTGLF